VQNSGQPGFVYQNVQQENSRPFFVQQGSHVFLTFVSFIYTHLAELAELHWILFIIYFQSVFF